MARYIHILVHTYIHVHVTGDLEHCSTKGLYMYTALPGCMYMYIYVHTVHVNTVTLAEEYQCVLTHLKMCELRYYTCITYMYIHVYTGIYTCTCM